jgi:DNA-binding transcriptional regulator YiaG
VELANLLSLWRERLGVSRAWLAERAAVTETTLYRWEKGLISAPRRQELSCVLDALSVSDLERSQAFACLTARQCLVNAPEYSSAGIDEDLLSTRPHSGVLIRALRERAGMSVAEAAARLKVSATTVTRWEAASNRLSPHNRERLIALLCRSDSERRLLRAEDWHKLMPSLDKCDERLAALYGQVDRDELTNGDAVFHLLETALWRHALNSASGHELLRVAYHLHGEWLLRQGRSTESAAAGERCIKLLKPAGGPRPDWFWGSGFVAQNVACVGSRRGAREALNYLRDIWLPAAEELGCETDILRDMADYASRAGRFRDAETLIARAIETAPRWNYPRSLHVARKVLARILLQSGNPHKAASVLPALVDECPTQQAEHALLAVEVFIAAGGQPEAATWMHTATTLINQHNLARLRWRAESWARIF